MDASGLHERKTSIGDVSIVAPATTSSVVETTSATTSSGSTDATSSQSSKRSENSSATTSSQAVKSTTSTSSQAFNIIPSPGAAGAHQHKAPPLAFSGTAAAGRGQIGGTTAGSGGTTHHPSWTSADGFERFGAGPWEQFGPAVAVARAVPAPAPSSMTAPGSFVEGTTPPNEDMDSDGSSEIEIVVGKFGEVKSTSRSLKKRTPGHSRAASSSTPHGEDDGATPAGPGGETIKSSPTGSESVASGKSSGRGKGAGRVGFPPPGPPEGRMNESGNGVQQHVSGNSTPAGYHHVPPPGGTIPPGGGPATSSSTTFVVGGPPPPPTQEGGGGASSRAAAAGPKKESKSSKETRKPTPIEEAYAEAIQLAERRSRSEASVRESKLSNSPEAGPLRSSPEGIGNGGVSGAAANRLAGDVSSTGNDVSSTTRNDVSSLDTEEAALYAAANWAGGSDLPWWHVPDEVELFWKVYMLLTRRTRWTDLVLPRKNHPGRGGPL